MSEDSCEIPNQLQLDEPLKLLTVGLTCCPQVTPELMLKLSRENSPETPRSTKQAKPLPSKKRPVVEGKEAERAAWLPAAPVFPGFLPTLPGPVLGQNVPPKQIQEQDSELAKIRKLLDDSVCSFTSQMVVLLVARFDYSACVGPQKYRLLQCSVLFAHPLQRLVYLRSGTLAGKDR